MSTGILNPQKTRLAFSASHVEWAVGGAENMRRDAALLECSALRWRIYTWDGPWISLGMYQDPVRDLRPGCEIPWVMRPTGGRGVLHGHDLTLGLSCPLLLLLEDGETVEQLSRSVRKVYRRITAPMIEAIRQAGVPAALGESTPFVSKLHKSADCFAHVSANDIVDERTGIKVCGVALRLTENAVLIQASIPISRPLVDPAAVFVDSAAAHWIGVDQPALAMSLEKHLPQLSRDK